MPIDLGQDQPLAGVEVDLSLPMLLYHELRHHVRGRDLLRQHPPLVEPPRRLHEEVGVALGDRAQLGGDARVEAEVALAPDRERVYRLFAGELVEQGVHDLAVVQVDLARERTVGSRRPRPRDSHEPAFMRQQLAHRERAALPGDAEGIRFLPRAVGAVFTQLTGRPIVCAAHRRRAGQPRSDDVGEIFEVSAHVRSLESFLG